MLSDIADVWFVLPVAMAISVLAISAGVGGGLFFVPFFSMVLGFEIRDAIGTSIIAQMVGTLGGRWVTRGAERSIGNMPECS